MSKEWGPSTLGRILTGSPRWRLRLVGETLELSVEGQVHRALVGAEPTIRARRGAAWTDLTLHPSSSAAVKVDGLPNALTEGLHSALAEIQSEQKLQRDVAILNDGYSSIRDWLEVVSTEVNRAKAQRSWITHETQEALLARKPRPDGTALWALLQNAGVRQRLRGDAEKIERSLTAWGADWSAVWSSVNEQHTERELKACKDLFGRVESEPLTEEQARAVICFDNRLQVIASAGSGKTSTMVAKAVYAIHRGFVAPERIVLLAFNKQAAEELKVRVAKSLERLGMQGMAVQASTFHSLGLHIIGQATGEKPDIPDWAIDPAGGFRKLTEIIDQLKDRSPAFRARWDLFRFVFGKDLPPAGSDVTADVWDAQGTGRLRTAKGETVKSLEEFMIANWLFYNGIDYRYEDNYLYKTADKDHRQYKPDFFYPGIDLYHEHFALNAQGQAPAHFEDYLEGVKWKRQLHADKGTSLFETTSHGLRNGDDFQRLEAELTSRGVALDPNPDRKIPQGGQKPMEATELAGLVRTFISHTKSNCLTVPAMRQRLDVMSEDTFKHRHRMFLDIVAPILVAWDEALAAEGGIDFEDMLNLAAEHLENARYEAPYELVMADEFQDASRARARLCRALVQKPGRFLFAVGDDWQSINRFAGADVSVMTGFRKWFGHGQILKLERTFRCPQALCDVSSQFVAKNPAQIAKRVRSATPALGPVLQAFQVDNKDKLTDAIDQFVVKLAKDVQNGTVPTGRNGKVSVFILGRYNADRQYIPGRKYRFERWVDLSFLTIHRSKGSEADYVILPEMLSVRRGRSFPNTRADDPVLALAMPDGDDFPLGEERRLFYVAITRARRSVALFTARGQCSSFLRELHQDGAVSITDTDGKSIREESCPVCKQGVLVLRTGPYGDFRSCSSFPDCGYKPKKYGQTTPPTDLQYGRQRAAPLLSKSRCAPASGPATSPRQTLSSMFKAINDGIKHISHNVERVKAVQAATSDLQRNIDSEQVAIESALQMATMDVQLEERLKDPMFRQMYQESYEELPRIRPDFREVESAHIENPIPNFERVDRHWDPDIEDAIRRSIDELREGREAFLSVTYAQLAGDPVVRARFLKKLEELKGSRYLAGLDPTSGWK